VSLSNGGVHPPRLTAAHIKELQSYDWLGNIIERAAIRSRDGHLELGLARVGPSRSPARRPSSATGPTASNSLAAIKDHERNLIVDALTQKRGKIYGANGAAALLGMKPTTLSSRVHRIGLKKLIAH